MQEGDRIYFLHIQHSFSMGKRWVGPESFNAQIQRFEIFEILIVSFCHPIELKHIKSDIMIPFSQKGFRYVK